MSNALKGLALLGVGVAAANELFNKQQTPDNRSANTDGFVLDEAKLQEIVKRFILQDPSLKVFLKGDTGADGALSLPISTAGLRALNLNDRHNDFYILTDGGKAGTVWKKRGAGNQNEDNGGTVLVTLDNIVYENQFKDLVYAKWFGFIGDDLTDNTAAFIALSKFVNARGGNCKIVFDEGIYRYKPTGFGFTGDQWRAAVELVDVKNVYIQGKGTVIKQIKDADWKTSGVNGGGNHLEESPMQFRSTGDRTCKNITIEQIHMLGARVEYLNNDGACFGFAFRGVENIYLRDCSATGWGTDGLYLGTTYNNTYRGFNAYIENCVFDNNTRQGASVVGIDNASFFKCSFMNTNGGTLGYGIDFEPNANQLQSGGSVKNCYFENNEKGALNFIRTQNIEVSGNRIVDKHNSSSGAIYVDGGIANYEVSNIHIHNNFIETNKAGLYLNGSFWNNIRFTNNSVKTVKAPNNLATIRVNPSANATNLGSLYVLNNSFTGTGGVLVNGTAKAGGTKTITAIALSSVVQITSAAHGLSNGDYITITGIVGTIELNNRAFIVQNVAADTFELQGVSGTNLTAWVSGGAIQPFWNLEAYVCGNTFTVSQEQAGALTDVFDIRSNIYAMMRFKDNRVTITASVNPVLANNVRVLPVLRGEIQGNALSSTTALKLFFTDIAPYGSRSTLILDNIFSANFYYKGAHASLDLPTAGAVVSWIGTNRVVHGGINRVNNGVDARIGDMTFDSTNGFVCYQCTVAGSPGTWVKVGQAQLSASATYNPPSVANGAQTTQTVTVTGAAIGDFVDVSFGLDLQGLRLTGYVSSANTVTCVLVNNTGGAVDLASDFLYVTVRKK